LAPRNELLNKEKEMEIS